MSNLKILSFAPMHNRKGKHDATGAFQPEAKKFKSMHGGDVVLIDNHKPKQEQRIDVYDAIQTDKPDVVAFFCHGWATGIDFGFTKKQLPALAACFAKESHPTVIIYGCLTGDGPANGDGGFADELRDALCRAGQTCCEVYAHTTPGHTTQNPYVRLFEGMGSSHGATGGTWIVRPGSALWPKWKRALKTDLRLRYPLMDVEQIHEEVSRVR